MQTFWMLSTHERKELQVSIVLVKSTVKKKFPVKNSKLFIQQSSPARDGLLSPRGSFRMQQRRRTALADKPPRPHLTAPTLRRFREPESGPKEPALGPNAVLYYAEKPVLRTPTTPHGPGVREWRGVGWGAQERQARPGAAAGCGSGRLATRDSAHSRVVGPPLSESERQSGPYPSESDRAAPTRVRVPPTHPPGVGAGRSDGGAAAAGGGKRPSARTPLAATLWMPMDGGWRAG